MFVLSGTKWCGPGDNAKDDADLGSDIELDMCCREHDHCNMSIPVNSTKFGLTNWLRYTRYGNARVSLYGKATAICEG